MVLTSLYIVVSNCPASQLMYRPGRLFCRVLKGESMVGHHINLNQMHLDISSCQWADRLVKSPT